MIPTDALERALAGTDPPGSRLTALQLGLQLQKHRRRSGRPYSESTILTYKAHPDMQSREFVEAFQSWYAAKTLRQQDFARVRFGEFTADDLLAEQGRILLLGDGPVRLLVGIATLPEHTLIQATRDGTAQVVESTAPVIACAVCGAPVVRRSWNQKRCSKCRGVRLKSDQHATP